jgi:hypothetical protein
MGDRLLTPGKISASARSQPHGSKPYGIYGFILASLQVPDTVRMDNPRFNEVLGFVAYF